MSIPRRVLAEAVNRRTLTVNTTTRRRQPSLDEDIKGETANIPGNVLPLADPRVFVLEKYREPGKMAVRDRGKGESEGGGEEEWLADIGERNFELIFLLV